MLNTIPDRHVVTTIFVESTFKVIICSGEGVLATELIKRIVALTHITIVLSDDDIGKLLHATVGNSLLHLHLDTTGSGIGGAIPCGVFPPESFIGEVIDLVLEVSHRGSIEHILRSKPKMPRPHHGAAFGDGNNGIAVLNLVLRNAELQELAIC